MRHCQLRLQHFPLQQLPVGHPDTLALRLPPGVPQQTALHVHLALNGRLHILLEGVGELGVLHDCRPSSGLCFDGGEDVDPGRVDDGDVGLELAR